jgi:glycosyltransferase involved in cell wall biosynthesis
MMRECKFLFAFNLANDFVPSVKVFRELGLEADILIPKTINSQRFADPLWEDPMFNKKWILEWNYKENILIRTRDTMSSLLGFKIKALNQSSIRKIGDKYDLIISTPPGPIYFYNHSKLIIYDAGWSRYFIHDKRLRSRLAQKSYRENKIVFTNPDMIPLFERLDVEHEFMPFAVEIDKYIPREDISDSGEQIIFNPARQDWFEKGNHHLIHGFAEAIYRGIKAKLQLTEWGKDVEYSKNLIKKLKIEKHVTWLSVVDKKELIERYYQSSVIADQFVIGSYGLATPEALSIGKPVLIKIKEEYYKKCHNGKSPPVLNCSTPEEIADQIVKLENENYRSKYKKNGRDWVVQEHHPLKVAEQQINLFHDKLLNS